MQLELSVASMGTGTLRVEVKHRQRWPRVRQEEAYAYISEQGGCACSLLADDADWDAAVWSMRPEVLESLRRTLVHLGSALSGGFVLQALWQGESSKEEFTVTAGEIADIAGNGNLGTHARYRVIANETA